MARPAQRSQRKRRKTVLTVDMTGVESGGRSIDDGWAHGVVKKATIKDSQSSDNEMIAMQWTATRKKEKATVFDNVVATESALWKMKGMLEALGIDVPDSSMDVDVEELPGLECDILIANEDYNGRDQPRIVEFRPTQEVDKDAEEDDEPEEEEERPAKKKVTKKAARKDDEEEEPEEEEEEEEEAPHRKKLSKKARDEEEEEPEEEPEEEEPEEEEERPKKKVAKKIRAGAKVTFEDENGKTARGVVKTVDGDTYVVKTLKGEEYELEGRDLELA